MEANILDHSVVLFPDRLKYESQKSTSSSVAVGNDFDFPSPAPGNLGFLRGRPGGRGGHTAQFVVCMFGVWGRVRTQAGAGAPLPPLLHSPRSEMALPASSPGVFVFVLSF